MTDFLDNNRQSFSLTYLKSFKIKDAAEGLAEPSGLALSHGGNALWTVSDDTNKIFKLSLDGHLKKKRCFKIPHNELEGIVLEPTGKYLFAVNESKNEIIQIEIDGQAVTNRKRLSTMSGYDAIAHFFSDNRVNKGLEGISWNAEKGTLFVIKESHPGLLIEVSPDLQTILSHCVLNGDNGFLDSSMDSEKIDFSDICYDHSRNCFWIISDKARRLFLYDREKNSVLQSAVLAYMKKGKYREIEKAEGIAINPESNRLYVVSDKEAVLYVFDIRS